MVKSYICPIMIIFLGSLANVILIFSIVTDLDLTSSSKNCNNRKYIAGYTRYLKVLPYISSNMVKYATPTSLVSVSVSFSSTIQHGETLFLAMSILNSHLTCQKCVGNIRFLVLLSSDVLFLPTLCLLIFIWLLCFCADKSQTSSHISELPCFTLYSSR